MSEYSENESDSLYDQSAAGLQWKLIEHDPRIIENFSQKLSISTIISKVLINRGISSIEDAQRFFNGKLKSELPDPFLLKDMDKASDRIVDAILKNEKVTIFGDYDVDGATSSALLYKFFKSLEVESDIYIPDRLKEGYGPNVNAMKLIKERGNHLLITVDCGTSAHEPLRVAKGLGLDVIVIDHHLVHGELPDVHAIVNPNRLDDDFPFKTIAAVSVAFFVTIAVRKKLRNINWFDSSNNNELDLMTLLDLVALGTVCDVMPLIGINRLFVKYGLQLINQRRNLGIAAILEIAKVKSVVKSHHLGYIIGPRINAGGRVDKSHFGAMLLKSESQSECYTIASQLEMLNEERKSIEQKALSEAFEYIENNYISQNYCIIVVGHNWHIGVLGIMASRIKEKYNKPVCIISINNGIGKGSARSVLGIDIGTIIGAAKANGLLIDGGGHAMAGGFSVHENKIAELNHFILESFESINEHQMFIDRASEVAIDSAIAVKAANLNLVESLEKLGPFGNINPMPRFVIYKAKLLQISIFAKNNLLLSITDHMQNYSGDTLKCVFFRACEKEIGALLLRSVGSFIDIIGSLQENKIDRRGVQFVVEDVILYDSKS